MFSVLKRNISLLVILAASLYVFLTMTVPALERERTLAELERHKAAEVQRLRREAARMQAQVRAIEQNDPAMLERAVRARFQYGAGDQE